MISDKGFRFIRPIIFGFLKLFFFIKIQGQENIPQTGGYIICSNHRSNLDPIIIAGGVPKMPYFMAKEELFKVAVLKSLIRYFRAFPIRRGKSDVSAVDHAIQIVEKGGALLMFPEGTRSMTGELLKPKSGVALIASHSGKPVVPCAIICKGKLRIFKKITLRFGNVIPNQAIKIEGKSASALRRSSTYIMEQIAGLM